ncbi:MAG: nitrogen regulation protein NR(II) [Gammaproteobacteria bacterium]|nr:nitrogen regulation protein NR(II) [Gammaproteobacteria bacterium]
MQIDIQKQIVDNLTTAVLMFNKELKLDYINAAGEMLFEISARRLIGMSIDELFINADEMIECLKQAAKNGQSFTERELHITIPGARAIDVDCVVTPMNDPNYDNALLIELIQMERHLRISREGNLVVQQELARTIIRGLAHEIKNPLGGLRGAAQLLERELSNDEQKEYTDIIIGEADRLQNLVDRMQGPKSLPQMETINIHQVIERVRSLVSAEVTDKIKLTRDYDPSIPDIYADQDQLIQAILNIVRNATQAIENEGEIILRTRTTRQFTIGQTRHRLVLRIDIIDDGSGVAPEIIKSIFYPMVTGRPEGTGLGLSIAQSLINQHGGLIECESEPGMTRFSVLLPL